MQTTRKAVRYYIDRDADTPIIRSVPVSCLTATPVAEPARARMDAPASAAAESRQRDARQRLASLVQASVRKHRHHAS